MPTPPQRIQGSNRNATDPTSSCSDVNTKTGCNCVVIEVSGTTGDKEINVKSYPIERAYCSYQVPLYYVKVYKAYSKSPADTPPQRNTFCEEKTFKAIRFAYFYNKKGVAGYNSAYSEGDYVVGLRQDKWYKISLYKDYTLHSYPTAENGAWVITGNHYFHAGPEDYTQHFGSAGCVELFGPGAFSSFSNTLVQYTKAGTRFAAPQKMPIWVHTVDNPGPPKKEVPRP